MTAQTPTLALPLQVTDTNFSNCECRLEDSRQFVIARVYERKHADAIVTACNSHAALQARAELAENAHRIVNDQRIALEKRCDTLDDENEALKAQVDEARKALEAGHHELISQALEGAATALPVLFTMCAKLGFREGATVADEINANVQTALKQFAHIRAALANLGSAK